MLILLYLLVQTELCDLREETAELRALEFRAKARIRQMEVSGGQSVSVFCWLFLSHRDYRLVLPVFLSSWCCSNLDYRLVFM